MRTFLEPVQHWHFITLPGAHSPQIVTAAPFRSVRLWDVGSGREMDVLTGSLDGKFLTASRAGGWLAASQRAADRTANSASIRLWSLPGAPEGRVIQGSDAPLTALLLSADGRLLAAAFQDRCLWLWQTSNGRLAHKMTGFDTASLHLAFGPAGDALACADGRQVRLWSLDDLSSLFHTAPLHIPGERLASALQGLPETGETQVERAWLHFVQDMQLWCRRYEIEIGPPLESIQIGDFEIEIEG
jgi:WD40 repeat protein